MTKGRWECCVLCDGHDLHGHLVARGICEMLSTVLLDKLADLSLDTIEAEQAIIQSFEECETRVSLTSCTLLQILIQGETIVDFLFLWFLEHWRSTQPIQMASDWHLECLARNK